MNWEKDYLIFYRHRKIKIIKIPNLNSDADVSGLLTNWICNLAISSDKVRELTREKSQDPKTWDGEIWTVFNEVEKLELTNSSELSFLSEVALIPLSEFNVP